jgi:hypothetical protein
MAQGRLVKVVLRRSHRLFLEERLLSVVGRLGRCLEMSVQWNVYPTSRMMAAVGFFGFSYLYLFWDENVGCAQVATKVNN